MNIKNNWIKRGVIYNPKQVSSWIHSHAYIPTPILLNDETIRIFVAFKDDKGIGRIGYVDVSAQNPFEVITVSNNPSLDIGIPGTFDDNGVTPISIVKHNDRLYLYYAGWQLSDKVRYFLFAGLAISDDMGVTFTRQQKVPILERTDKEFLVRTAPSVLKQDNVWHMLYCGGGKNIIIDKKVMPSYSLKYLTSNDGIKWTGEPLEVLIPEASSEYGFGRPCIKHEDGIYKMWYSIRRFDKKYTFGYAQSSDLIQWTRLDDQIQSLHDNLQPYENEMQSFAAIIETKYGNYMFYNGNNYGATGICFASQQL